MAQLGRGAVLKAWFKRCWTNQPAVVAASFMPVIPVIAAIYNQIKTKRNGGVSNKYLLVPFVVRPGDPRLKQIKKTSNLDKVGYIELFKEN